MSKALFSLTRIMLACGASLLAPSAVSAAEPTTDTYNIGFFPYMFGGAPENDARAAFKSWVQVIGRESGVKVASSSRVFANPQDAVLAARAGQVDIIALSSVDYLGIREQLPPGVILSPIRSTGQTEQYVLVAHRDAPGASLADFAGKIFTQVSPASALLAPLWLESELRAAGLPPAARHFADVRSAEKPAKVVLPVFFKQADLCLVPLHAYDTLCEMNPQVQKQLRIIARSPRLVTTLVWVALPPDSNLHVRALNAIRNLQNTTSGRQTLLMFQFQRMQDCSAELLDSTRLLLGMQPLGAVPSSEKPPPKP